MPASSPERTRHKSRQSENFVLVDTPYAPPVAQLRIALAQLNGVVGDLTGNAERVASWSARAAAAGAHLVAFPEMTITGYPPEDLVLRSSFLDASRATVETLAARLAADGLGALAVVVGYCDRCPDPRPQVGRPAGEPQNAAALLFGGSVAARYAKHHLPNYGVFDEFRYFVRGDAFPILRLHSVDVGITICEDLWQEGGPVAVAGQTGVDVLLCINGSPYERGKSHTRDALAARRAREAGAYLAYVNTVGGQDELVFDGDSLAVDPAGNLLVRARQFDEELLVVDVDVEPRRSEVAGPVDARDDTTMTVERITLAADPVAAYPAEPYTVEPRLDSDEELYRAVVTGTRDYIEKNRFPSIVLGLSGGIDSALVATIAVDALGAERVNTVAMPSRYSSQHSLDDAAELARRQGVHHRVLRIGDVFDAFQNQLGLTGLAEENLQARIRGTILMGLSNQFGHLVLTTGNKSELATGFSTLYGDSAGGFAPIKDVPKTLVWALARWRNAHAVSRGQEQPIPGQIITKPPSAELAPGQLDSDRLPDYAELDDILDAYVERDLGREQLLAAGHDPAIVDRVIRLVDGAEYKRRQNPPGPKVTSKAFGRDRRLPITSAWRELVTPWATEPRELRPDLYQ